MAGIYTTNSTQSAASSATDKTNNRTNKTNELGKDDFLKLLITQLRYQDPMEPMEDKDFIAQMAQFTSLEQMKNLNTSMQMSQASGLIGKVVSWAQGGQLYYGMVNSVQIVNGEARLVLDENTTVGLSEVISVTEIPVDYTTGQMTQASTLIGKTVGWIDKDGKETYGVVNSVRLVDGVPKLVIGDSTIGLSEVTSVKDSSTGD
ncbi:MULTISPECIES: flagellar hook assembly protein FlgD [Sporomusa]|uniref:Basal-body rod modification protein FlgD n=1 Tax=Sporomusa sphaeroides DSM 2875 TaxID=1337886 RepID=A0ABM9VXT6_9FIRM|nr:MULTISPECIES: flagellar hook assembly protein FlgD [Sporomusa]MCM0760190.1 flagellar hook assembly protein FlgD [Sporomusa sphaeroides DSM 2875]OLS58161.1 flagellar basal body rod modification protein [Sporomusa sphaeroides DSM 2875]CVK17652.1 flagellar basal body rod modification protein [Sporomusa sphaeroides DSM 2875]